MKSYFFPKIRLGETSIILINNIILNVYRYIMKQKLIDFKKKGQKSYTCEINYLLMA